MTLEFRINHYVILVCIVLLIGCTSKQNNKFINLNTEIKNDFDLDFKEFCQIDLINGNYELNAVKCALFGDYQNAIEQAT
ncbi:MAG: hypothetical protein GY705_07355 [Bacteroidetes bacterium]|nr:hypothetical protein [Bacteroidota bacterium]